MDLRLDLGNTVRARRLELGLSQGQLAGRMGHGIQQTDISRIERGRLPWPRPELLQALAVGLELSTLELLTKSGWMSEDELEHFRTVRGVTSARERKPLAVVGQLGSDAGQSLAGLLPESRFRVLTMSDSETLFDTLRTQQPAVALVHQAIPALSLDELASEIWRCRLDITVIVVGHRRSAVPSAFYFLPEPSDADAIESILAAVGLE